MASSTRSQHQVRRPEALRPGDTVAVVSPSSAAPADRLDAGLAVLRAWGLRPVEGHHAREVRGHLAGTDEHRLADLNAAFRDSSVRAVWAARGGYGITRILDRLEWRALARDPKLLIGFSDVTALLLAAWQRVGLVTVHGQFVARLQLQHAAGLERLRRILFGEPVDPLLMSDTPTAIAPGRAGGRLVGGNLAVLAALAGTGDQLRARGCIVLLEDVAEPPYRVDRLLTQLRGSGGLDGVAGVVVGRMTGCEPAHGTLSATLDEVLADRLGDLGVPVLTGVPIGHVDDQAAVLHGARAVVDADAGVLEVDADLGTGR